MRQTGADLSDATREVILLDIDGTLNEAQQPLTFCMQKKLQQLARHKIVYFVTGNSYTKSVDILNGPIGMYAGVFCLNADELRTMRGKVIWEDSDTPPLPDITQQWINYITGHSQKNNCIDWRSPRFVNFSKVGRYATKEERDEHDASWREKFIEDMCCKDTVECSIGGKVSVDIYSKGADKARAARWVNSTGRKFIFIGDKTDAGGNDYAVKKYCEDNSENICLTTTGPIHTMDYINKILRI